MAAGLSAYFIPVLQLRQGNAGKDHLLFKNVELDLSVILSEAKNLVFTNFRLNLPKLGLLTR